MGRENFQDSDQNGTITPPLATLFIVILELFLIFSRIPGPKTCRICPHDAPLPPRHYKLNLFIYNDLWNSSHFKKFWRIF